MVEDNNIKVASFEDNKFLSELLSILINDTPGLKLTGAFQHCRHAINHCQTHKPNVILMDIEMPDITGIETTDLIKNNFPEIQILVLTTYEDRDKIFGALCAGASGYILKKSSNQEIVNAIKEIHKGGAPMTPQIARKALDFFSLNKNKNTSQNFYNLTQRELDIVKRLIEGDSYKMICTHLNIEMGTVRAHIMNVYRKLHVNSKSEVVAKAIREQII